MRTEKQRTIVAQNALDYRPFATAVNNTDHEYFTVPKVTNNKLVPIIITGRFRSGSIYCGIFSGIYQNVLHIMSRLMNEDGLTLIEVTA